MVGISQSNHALSIGSDFDKLTRISQMHKLTSDDQKLRKAILDCAGNLALAAQQLGIEREQIYQKLRYNKHKVWWNQAKKRFSRLRANARQRRWYHNSKNRMLSLTNELTRDDDL